MTPANLSVLIPTHGRPTLLGRTLTSLAACRLPEGYREAVVVENGPQAGAEAVVAEAAEAHPHLRLRYLHVERANKSHALNEALKTVGDGLAVFFDDDVRLEPGVLEAYAEAAERHPARAFFGGSFGCDYEVPPPTWLLPLLPASAKGVDLTSADRPPEYLGFNWAAYSEDMRALGGFDSAYGPGSESGASGQESDMQRRLRAEGVLEIDVPDAYVWHYVPEQRCSPEWAMRRAYRTGTSYGRRDKADKASSWPMSEFVQVGRSCIGLARYRISGDKEAWWRSRLAFSLAAGKLVGYFSYR